ncbi:MAG: hypothetical protein ACREDH_15620 [Methylocella sp.]
MIYHTGYLACDRGEYPRARTSAQTRLDDEATAMWNMAEAGKLVLVQRRLGYMCYEYHAIPIKGAI